VRAITQAPEFGKLTAEIVLVTERAGAELRGAYPGKNLSERAIRSLWPGSAKTRLHRVFVGDGGRPKDASLRMTVIWSSALH